MPPKNHNITAIVPRVAFLFLPHQIKINPAKPFSTYILYYLFAVSRYPTVFLSSPDYYDKKCV